MFIATCARSFLCYSQYIPALHWCALALLWCIATGLGTPRYQVIVSILRHICALLWCISVMFTLGLYSLQALVRLGLPLLARVLH